MSKEVRDFPIYTAESIVSIEKMTGKSVKMLEFENQESTLVVDGQTRTESKHRISLVFFDPPTGSVADTSATESKPLLDIAESKTRKSKSKPSDA
jgi:phage terminase large subunit-like protein